MTYSSPSPLLGRGRDPLRSSGRVRGVKSGSDRLEHARRILKHVIVPETQDSEAIPAKIGIAPPVGSTVAMLTAVGFDDQQTFEAGKIDDVGIDDVLATELGGGHSTVAQHSPEASLGRRRVGAHSAGAVAQLSKAFAFII